MMINIAELLKDCPEGTKLYSPLLGEVEFAEVMNTNYVPIRVMKRGYGLRFDEYGRYMGNEYPDSECLLFPSKDCRTWEGWKPPVEPKFKVGDSLQLGSMWAMVRRIDTENQRYICQFDNVIPFEEQDRWNFVPNPKKHYAIANFHAGMPVLVRDYDNSRWSYVQFSHYVGEECGFKFNACGIPYIQCIPFNEETKHLLGTTDMPSEEYINW